MLGSKVFKLLFLSLFSISTLIFFKQNIFAAEEVKEKQADESLEVTPPPTAIQPINLTVSPVTLNLATDPGREVNSSIKIFNNSTEKEYLQLELVKFTSDKSGSQPHIQNFSENDEYKDWLTFEKSEFEVNPGEWQTIDLIFSPPKEAALAYYYAIVVKRQVDTREEGVTTVIIGAPAILVLANVYSPNAVQELQLVDFKTKQKFYEYLPADFEIKIKNTGNIHLNPMGNIFIDSSGEKDVALLSINKDNGLILPDSQRVFETSWEEGFPSYEPLVVGGVVKKDEDGKTIKKLKWDFSKISQFRIGKYTAHLLLVYDNGERDIPIESIVSFWVIPWRILLGALVVIVLISLGIILPLIMLRRRVKKQD